MGFDIARVISQLLGGQYSPTGIGTNPPAQLGPQPGYNAQSQGDIFNPQSAGGMQRAFGALAPYLSLIGSGSPQGSGALGGGGGVAQQAPTGTGQGTPVQTPVGGGSDLLAKIITALVSPASAPGAATGTSGAAATATPTNTTDPLIYQPGVGWVLNPNWAGASGSNLSPLGFLGGGAGTGGGAPGASASSGSFDASKGTGTGPGTGIDTGGLGSPVGERGPGTGMFGQ